MSKGSISNQSTEKALAVLEFLVAQPEPLKLLEIAKKLDMNASTTSRYLSALQSCGYVDEDTVNYRYSASTKICELANILLSRFELSSFMHPYLQKASAHFEETACLSIDRNHTVLYIDISMGSNRTLMNVQRIGNSAPLHCTAAGKLFLTKYTEDQLDLYIAEKTLEKYTGNTITEKSKLQEELKAIEQRGYSIDEGELEDDIRCIAYPIYDSKGNIAACIGITAPASRLTPAVIEEKHQLMEEIADEASRKLSSLPYFNI